MTYNLVCDIMSLLKCHL